MALTAAEKKVINTMIDAKVNPVIAQVADHEARLKALEGATEPVPPTPPTSGAWLPRPGWTPPAGVQQVPVPSGIAVDNSGDQSVAISNWMAGLSAGTVAVFRPGIYRLARYIDPKPGVVMAGYGARLNCVGTPGHDGSAIRAWKNGDFEVRGFEISGQNTEAGTPTGLKGSPAEFTMGINWAGNGKFKVADLWVHHVYGDAFFNAGWSDVDYAPAGYEIDHCLFEKIGRNGVVINQNDSGQVWVHHSTIRDVGLYCIDGEDNRMPSQCLRNVLIEDTEFGTYSWHPAYNPRCISFVYSFWEPLPNVSEVGPVVIRRCRWVGGAAPGSDSKWGSNHGIIDQQGVSTADGDYHDWLVEDCDFTAFPAAQKSRAYWLRVPNTRGVVARNNKGLDAMATRYITSGSSGVSIQ